MQDHGDGAPSWLFSFLDLALLMLIAMTQLAPDTPPEVPNLGQMVVPRIGEAGSDELATESVEVWQLRVHPPEVAFRLPMSWCTSSMASPWTKGSGSRARRCAWSSRA